MDTCFIQSPVKFWCAVYVVGGLVRRMIFEAVDEIEAREFAVRCGAGLEGETQQMNSPAPATAYDEKTARALLGNISPSTLYRELAVGNLQRVPGIRKILVTRESIEAWPKRRV